MPSVVNSGKSKVASLLDVAYDLLGFTGILEEVRSPILSDGPIELINPLLGPLGRDDGVIVS